MCFAPAKCCSVYLMFVLVINSMEIPLPFKGQRRADQIGELANAGRVGKRVRLVATVNVCAHLTFSYW